MFWDLVFGILVKEAEVSMDEITIRTDNTPMGTRAIERLWNDVVTGVVPLLSHAEPGQFPIARYSAYASDANGAFDLTILLADSGRVGQLEAETESGEYRRYQETGVDVAACTVQAWQRVWDEERAGKLRRAYSEDFEVSTPAEYAPDGQAKCVLYISQAR